MQSPPLKIDRNWLITFDLFCTSGQICRLVTIGKFGECAAIAWNLHLLQPEQVNEAYLQPAFNGRGYKRCATALREAGDDQRLLGLLKQA